MSPLLVIVGETASGKTALAIALAKQFNGEIIAADSRTVYRGMDVGTAKPSLTEQAGVPHYGLDVVDPGEKFSAFDFQQLATKAIIDIHTRGKLPIIVGGTGLYIDALLYDFAFRPAPDIAQRLALQSLSAAELQARIIKAGLPMPENSHNPRHLIRVLEGGAAPRQPRKLRPGTLLLGLTLPRDLLRTRIEQRVDAMIEAGMIDEVRRLMHDYGDVEALRAPGYRAVRAYIEGMITLDEAKREFVRNDLRLAKRQRVWFKRNPDIHWLPGTDTFETASAMVRAFLDRP